MSDKDYHSDLEPFTIEEGDIQVIDLKSDIKVTKKSKENKHENHPEYVKLRWHKGKTRLFCERVGCNAWV